MEISTKNEMRNMPFNFGKHTSMEESKNKGVAGEGKVVSELMGCKSPLKGSIKKGRWCVKEVPDGKSDQEVTDMCRDKDNGKIKMVVEENSLVHESSTASKNSSLREKEVNVADPMKWQRNLTELSPLMKAQW